MSRLPTGQRPLGLTEELERLEQSITLTLQEIDHNFSRAHRIVTSSILPIIEQYADHSRAVWDGSKFWKQFFEASANVSLSGYEEPEQGQEASEQDEESDQATTHTTLNTSESYETPTARHISPDSIENVDLSNLTISPSHSTPRPQRDVHKPRRSPYRSLRQDTDSKKSNGKTSMRGIGDPHTPSKQSSSLLDDVAMTPQQSPELKREKLPAHPIGTSQKSQDPLLHAVLDKKYRIQATPLTSKHSSKAINTSKFATDNILESSPLAPPELHTEVFDSPVRRELTQQLNKPRTPGLSVLTPRHDKNLALKPSNAGVWDDSDDDLIDEQTGLPFGASPPKTMQFHVPQSRLMKTPAKEASKQIVDNILASAGLPRGANGEDLSEDIDLELDRDYEDDAYDESSPSVIRKADVLNDDTF